MANQENAIHQVDQLLTTGMSRVGFGTIFKAWRGSKGIDYIIVGINTQRKEIYAVKHNAINEDSSVNSLVRKHKRVLKYTLTPSGRVAIVRGITSVMGQKRNLDVQKITEFNRRVDSSVNVIPLGSIPLYTPPLVDRRNTIVYE